MTCLDEVVICWESFEGKVFISGVWTHHDSVTSAKAPLWSKPVISVDEDGIVGITWHYHGWNLLSKYKMNERMCHIIWTHPFPSLSLLPLPIIIFITHSVAFLSNVQFSLICPGDKRGSPFPPKGREINISLTVSKFQLGQNVMMAKFIEKPQFISSNV